MHPTKPSRPGGCHASGAVCPSRSDPDAQNAELKHGAFATGACAICCGGARNHTSHHLAEGARGIHRSERGSPNSFLARGRSRGFLAAASITRKLQLDEDAKRVAWALEAEVMEETARQAWVALHRRVMMRSDLSGPVLDRETFSGSKRDFVAAAERLRSSFERAKAARLRNY